MKILFVDFELPYLLRDSENPVGGWAVELNCWLQGLDIAGHRGAVLSWKGAKEYAGDVTHCEILDTYDPKKGLRGVKFFYSYIPAMLGAAGKFDPDVIVQACAGVNTGIMAFIARALRVPFVYRVAHDSDADDGYKSRLPKYAQVAYRFGLSNAAVIVCQNQYQQRELRKRYPRANLPIVHNPFASPTELEMIIPRSKRNGIGWLAVFHDRKNMPLLCSIARNLPDVSFRVVGMPSYPVSSDVQAAIAELNKLPNVEMLGYLRRTEVVPFLSNIVALLNTSNNEGFSNVFLESFAAGTPLLIRDMIDPDGIVANCGLGMVSGNEVQLERAVKTMLSMPLDEFHAMSRRCREYVATNHSVSSKVHELISVLSPVVDGTPAGSV